MKSIEKANRPLLEQRELSFQLAQYFIDYLESSFIDNDEKKRKASIKSLAKHIPQIKTDHQLNLIESKSRGIDFVSFFSAVMSPKKIHTADEIREFLNIGDLDAEKMNNVEKNFDLAGYEWLRSHNILALEPKATDPKILLHSARARYSFFFTTLLSSQDEK